MMMMMMIIITTTTIIIIIIIIIINVFIPIKIKTAYLVLYFKIVIEISIYELENNITLHVKIV